MKLKYFIPVFLLSIALVSCTDDNKFTPGAGAGGDSNLNAGTGGDTPAAPKYISCPADLSGFDSSVFAGAITPISSQAPASNPNALQSNDWNLVALAPNFGGGYKLVDNYSKYTYQGTQYVSSPITGIGNFQCVYRTNLETSAHSSQSKIVETFLTQVTTALSNVKYVDMAEINKQLGKLVPYAEQLDKSFTLIQNEVMKQYAAVNNFFVTYYRYYFKKDISNLVTVAYSKPFDTSGFLKDGNFGLSGMPFSGEMSESTNSVSCADSSNSPVKCQFPIGSSTSGVYVKNVYYKNESSWDQGLKTQQAKEALQAFDSWLHLSSLPWIGSTFTNATAPKTGVNRRDIYLQVATTATGGQVLVMSAKSGVTWNHTTLQRLGDAANRTFGTDISMPIFWGCSTTTYKVAIKSLTSESQELNLGKVEKSDTYFWNDYKWVSYPNKLTIGKPNQISLETLSAILRLVNNTVVFTLPDYNEGGEFSKIPGLPAGIDDAAYCNDTFGALFLTD